MALRSFANFGAAKLFLRRSPHRPSRLEALSAEYRPSLCRFKRYGRFLSALRASRFRFRSNCPASSASSSNLGSFCFTPLATLRFVFESLVGEEHLFASSEYELGATLRTLQYLIVEFHGRLPWPRRARRDELVFHHGPGTVNWTHARGPKHGSSGRRAKNLNVFPTYA
jgi:hypothetical protein